MTFNIEKGWKIHEIGFVPQNAFIPRRANWRLGVCGPTIGLPDLHYGVQLRDEEDVLANSEKDRIAVKVDTRWSDFQTPLGDKRRYPLPQFGAFWDVGKRYAELTKVQSEPGYFTCCHL